MHHRPPVNHRARCLQILARAFAQFIERVEDDFVCVVVFALRKVDSVKAVEQLEQLLINFAKCEGAIDTQLRRCRILPKTATEPDLGG